MYIKINFDEEKYRYDIEMLINSFFPKRDKEKEEHICALYLKKEADILSASLWYIKDEAESICEEECFRIIENFESENKENKEKIELIGSKCQTLVTDDVKEIKNTLKQLAYQVISSSTGVELPWGILTGIRPTKLAMQLLEENAEIKDEDIKEYLQNKYYVSDDKCRLAIDIARYEKELLKEIDYKDGYSLYIGIPFCPTTCLYCSFTSYPIKAYAKKADEYVDCLLRELEYSAEKFKGKKLNTVYWGGGTPTTLTAKQLDKVMTRVEELFDFTYLKEYTVEAGRPDSITEDKLEVLKKHNIDRISVNPQTMKQETLDIIGRRHTVEDVKTAFNLARKLRFNNINMDFIVGLPNENIDDVRQTMEEILKLSPDSITIHSLAIKRAARLNMFKEKYKEMTIENNMEIMDMCQVYAKKLNMKPYYMYRQKNMAGNMENVGYAREGAAGIYNILIMEEKQTIVACGAGSSSKRVYEDGRIERAINVKEVNVYIDKIHEMIERKRKLFYDL